MSSSSLDGFKLYNQKLQDFFNRIVRKYMFVGVLVENFFGIR